VEYVDRRSFAPDANCYRHIGALGAIGALLRARAPIESEGTYRAVCEVGRGEWRQRSRAKSFEAHGYFATIPDLIVLVCDLRAIHRHVAETWDAAHWPSRA
jgi:hypothetical protein